MMIIKKTELPNDGTPKLVRGPIVKFMKIVEFKNKAWLYWLEDEENKPNKNYYFAPISKEVSDPAKWEWFDTVKIDGRVKHYFVMEG